MNFHFSLGPSVLFVATLSTLALSGCSVNSLSTPTDSFQGAAIQGVAHGGYQPLTGAHIYLLAAATSGYGAASMSLLTAGDGSDSIGYYVVTSNGGGFNISGDYTCATGQQVYLLATGGNPGLSPASYSNSAAVLIAALGTCPSSGTFAGQIPFITVNEVSTVAAAYALAGFTVDYTHIGAANTTQSRLGMVNAFNNIFNIINLNYGQAYDTTPGVSGYSSSSGLSANGVVPKAKLYTLANVAAGCVNSTGPASAACTTFFNNTPSNAGIKPTTVAAALINLAHNPANTYNFVTLSTGTAPFQPTLTSAPTDWALSVKYAGPNTSQPGRPAIDAAGNVWVPNLGNNSLTQFSPQGVVYSGTAGYTGSGMNQPDALAVDSSGNVWVANLGSGVASEFNNTGTPATVSGYSTQNGASYGVAIGQVNTWVSGSSSTTGLSPSGALVYRGTASTTDVGVAVDASDRVWMADLVSNQVAVIYTVTLGRAESTFALTGLNAPAAISIDASSNLWLANSGANTVTKVTTGNTLGLPTTGTVTTTASGAAGIFKPYYTAVDGAGTIWVGNTNGSLANLTSGAVALSNSSGYTTASTTAYRANPSATVLGMIPAYSIYGLAIDPSGNVWGSDVDGSLYQFLGIAAPTRTPLAYNNTGSRP